MPQIHLHAEVGDYAPLVLLPGDPGRATRIAQRFDGGLEAARLVNENRGLLGYTGTFQGVPVSVQSTGIGTPSMSIVVEELLRLGATHLVRTGTVGGIGRGIRTGDLIIATAAAPVDGATEIYLHGEPYAPAADFDLTRALVDEARRRGLRTHVGPIATVAVFYNPDRDYASRWRARGVLGFEMESSALFYLAAHATAHAAATDGRDVRAASILTVTDVLSEEVTIEETYMEFDALTRATDAMIDVALAAATTI